MSQHADNPFSASVSLLTNKSSNSLPLSREFRLWLCYSPTKHAASRAVLSAIKRTNNEVNSDFNSAYENYGNDISRYRSRIYLDIGMMAGGTVLAVFGKNFTVQDIGLATATQGVLLIFLDGIMYASHNAKMMKWAKAMRIHTSANSVGISYTF